MAKTDFHILLALIAPLLVWPWLPAWDHAYFSNGIVYTVALFTLFPLAEEMLFRGLIQGWLLEKRRFNLRTFGASRANLSTSLLFACAHAWQHAFILIPGYFIVSLLLGHFRERYRGIKVPVLLHGYYNLVLMIASG